MLKRFIQSIGSSRTRYLGQDARGKADYPNPETLCYQVGGDAKAFLWAREEKKL